LTWSPGLLSTGALKATDQLKVALTWSLTPSSTVTA
jgi:hypothetical protein